MKKYLILCLILFYSQIGLSGQAYIAPTLALTANSANRNVIDKNHEEQYHNSVYEDDNFIGYFVMERESDQKDLEYILVKRFQTTTYYSCGEHMLNYSERSEYVRHATEDEIKKFKSISKKHFITLTVLVVLAGIAVIILLYVDVKFLMKS